MIVNKNNRRQLVVCNILGLVIAGIAFTGIFFRGESKSVEVTSVRGENYTMIKDGIYQFNSQRMVAEGVGWDIFTLFIALPIFFILMPFLYRNSLRAKLLAVGLLVYFFYQYLMYALAWAFGLLFPAYIFIYAVSLFVAVCIVSGIDQKELTKRIETDFPRKGVVTLCVMVALMLVFMWTQRIIGGLQGDLETGMLLGQTTMVVQALDLGLIVPLALVTAYLAWKKYPWGYLLSPVLMVKAVAMAGAICAMLISAWIVEEKSQLLNLLIFGAVFIASGYLGYRMLRGA